MTTKERTVETPILLRGDLLPVVEASGVAETASTEARSLLWGLDLTECATRREARASWQHAMYGVKAELDQHPGIRRVCIACQRPRRFPQSLGVRVPGGLSLQIHNDLERDRGRYVQALVLDVTECEEPDVLRARLREALGCESRGWNDLTLSWDEISDCSFREAWEAQTF